jgi:hypothetical protein
MEGLHGERSLGAFARAAIGSFDLEEGGICMEQYYSG